MTTPDPQFVDRVFDIARGRANAARADWEHRAFKRRACDGWVALVHFDEHGVKSAPVTARCEDLSAGGMGVYSWRELPVGGRGALMVRRRDGRPLLLGARVAWCRHRGDLDYQCGLQFSTRPEAVTLEDFRDDDGTPLRLGPALAA